jgi:hypothetical protein
MNEMKGKGREWHDGVINTLPFHIKIRGSVSFTISCLA